MPDEHVLPIKLREIETAPENFSTHSDEQLAKWRCEYNPEDFSYLHVYFPITGHAPATYYLSIDAAARAQQAAKNDKMGKLGTAMC